MFIEASLLLLGLTLTQDAGLMQNTVTAFGIMAQNDVVRLVQRSAMKKRLQETLYWKHIKKHIDDFILAFALKKCQMQSSMSGALRLIVEGMHV